MFKLNFEKLAHVDIPDIEEITEEVRTANSARVFTGGVRINKSMYRTVEEDRLYRLKSLQKKLP